MRLFDISGLTLVAWLAICSVGQADLIEFISGSKVEGRIVDRDDRSVTVTTHVAGRELTRKYPIDRILAITVGDKREVLNESAKPPARDSNTAPGGEARGSAGSGKAGMSKAEIDALVERVGRTPPDWWDLVQLKYPTTLDLSWPERPGGKWDNQRNVGQYIWDVINTNSSKWREGVKFMHHLLSIHKDDPAKRIRIMQELGRMYQDLLQDYGRAIFWWRNSGTGRLADDHHGVRLAECYWKLGNKAMAAELLNKLQPSFAGIKLAADMGETAYALRMADANAQGQWGDMALLLAGDACRVAGRHEQAIGYYKRVLAMPATGKMQKRIERSHHRAQANIEGIRLFDGLDLRRVPDGAYLASSMGYEAPVVVEVLVKGNRIESVRVVDHHEKQYYATMIETPAKIIAKQSVKGVDTTSRATITSEAIINATAKALSAAMR